MLSLRRLRPLASGGLLAVSVWACAGDPGSSSAGLDSLATESLDTRVQAETKACTPFCPAGSRLATFAKTERALAQDTFGGAFLYVKEGCETYCEPLIRCVPPNVPVVAQDDFRCQLLPGYSRLEAPDEVDLSFGTLWDADRVKP